MTANSEIDFQGPVVTASVQMVSTPRVDENIARMNYWVGQAAERGAQLVLLPEYFCLMGDDGDKVRIREPHGTGADSPIQRALSQAASRYRVWLIGGTVPLVASTPDRVRNAVLVYGPDGIERALRQDSFICIHKRKRKL